MMKKRVLLLTIGLLLIIILITSSYAQDAGPGSPSETTKSGEQTHISTKDDRAPGAISSSTTAEGPQIVDAQIPLGSIVSVSNGDLTSSNIDVAETKSGIKINTGIDVTISRNGNVAVGTAQTIQIGSITITNVNNLKYDDEKKSLAFDAAQKLIESQRMFSFDNLKETTITIQNNVIQTIEAKTRHHI